MSRHLTLEIHRADRLDPETVRALWRLRTGIVRLKPHVDPEADFEAFAARVRAGTRVVIGRDPDGVPRGMYLGAISDIDPGRWGLNVLVPDYGFVEPAWRGHPAVATGFVRVTLADVARAPRRRAVIVGSMYPASFFRFASVATVRTRLDPDLPAPIAAALDHVGAAHYGDRWDASTGLVELPTLPEARLTRRPRTPAEQAVLDRYTALNPDWRDGVAVLGAVPLDGRVALRALRLAARRLIRERRG